MTPLDRIAHVIDLGAYRLAAVMIRLYVDDTLESVLANPRPLAEPIPYKGALGLRELPAEVEALIWQQIGEPR